MEKEPSLSDAYPPQEIVRKVERLGVAKAHADTLTLLVLAVLAGARISLGVLLFKVVVTGSGLGFGLTRLLGGVSFCLGLILVVWADIAGMGDGAVGEMAVRIARARADLPLAEAFTRGILCNALVCLAVWMAIGAVSIVGAGRSILAVTAGNVVGGTLLVAGMYWVAYLRSERMRNDRPS